MAKVYLQAGNKLKMASIFIVGSRVSPADLQLNLAESMEYNGDFIESGFTDSQGWTYNVFLEKETGRLWYDDEMGY